MFALAFLAIFLALWHEHDLQRIAILELLIAVVAVRIAWLFAGSCFRAAAGRSGCCRSPTRRRGGLRWFAVLFAALWGLGSFCRAVLMGGGSERGDDRSPA